VDGFMVFCVFALLQSSFYEGKPEKDSDEPPHHSTMSNVTVADFRDFVKKKIPEMKPKMSFINQILCLTASVFRCYVVRQRIWFII